MNGAKVRLSGNKTLQLNFLLSQLHETNAHLGEFKYVWNRDLGLFLYGIYNYHCVFDLRLTVLYLKKMLNVFIRLASYGVCFLLVSANTKLINEQVFLPIPKLRLVQIQYASGLWYPGTLTNWFYNQVDRPLGVYKSTNSMFSFPSVAFFLDTSSENFAVKEAISLDLVSCALVDSDLNIPLDRLTYYVPMNDDSSAAKLLIIKLCLSAIVKGERMLFDSFVRSRKKGSVVRVVDATRSSITDKISYNHSLKLSNKKFDNKILKVKKVL